MGESSAIAWTDATFNPWWGCQRVSPGCEHCYAETFSKRVGLKVWGPTTERRLFGAKHWAEPRKWDAKAAREGTRRRVFCASMADVFEDRRDLDTPREWLWALIEETTHLDWLLLTKRPENMRRLAPTRWAEEWPTNVWAGTTTEDQAHYETRWPRLALVPARIRFISHEPALGPLKIHEALGSDDTDVWPDWIITGGESGHGARPYDVDWARSLIYQAGVNDAAMFVKQLGAKPTDGSAPMQLRDAKGGDTAEWPGGLRVQEWPRAG